MLDSRSYTPCSRNKRVGKLLGQIVRTLGVIEKSGGPKYVVMTREEYNEMRQPNGNAIDR